MLLYIIIASLIVSLVALIGLIVVSKKMILKGVSLKWVVSLAAGALLAVSFLDLLPEAVEEYSGEVHNIFLTVLISFLIFFVMEKIWHWHHCHCHNDHHVDRKEKKHIAYTNLIGDGIHNLTDGFLIATSFMIDTRLGIITTAAVILHEIPQEISDFGILLYAGFSRKKALLANAIFALTALVGAVVFYYFGQRFEHLVPFMAAFAAGNFIYLAAADLIPELHHENNPRRVVWHTILLIVGVLIIFGITKIIPHSS